MSYLELAKKVEEQRRQEPCAPQRAQTSPKARLWALLDTWSDLDETTWPQEAVDQLKDEILDIFRDHPTKADEWFREWRATHPKARLS